MRTPQTVAEAYLLTSITCYLDADVLIMATGFTITIFVALSLFSLQVSVDSAMPFTIWRHNKTIIPTD